MAGHRDDGTFAEDKAYHPNRKIVRPRIASLVGWHYPEEADAEDKDTYAPLANKVSKGQTPRDRRVISQALKKEYGYRKQEAALNKIEDPDTRAYMAHHGIYNINHVDEDDVAVWSAMKNKSNGSSHKSEWQPDEREDRHLKDSWE